MKTEKNVLALVREVGKFINGNEVSEALEITSSQATAALHRLLVFGCVGRKMLPGAHKAQWHYWYVAQLPPHERCVELMHEYRERLAAGHAPLSAVPLPPPPAPNPKTTQTLIRETPEQTPLMFESSVTFRVKDGEYTYPASVARALYAEMGRMFLGG